VAVDAAGNVFVAENDAGTVKEILPDGSVRTIGSGFDRPGQVAVDSAGNVFVALPWDGVVKKIQPDGTIVEIGSRFSLPSGVAVDSAGNVYVSDSGLGVVEKLLPNGTVVTIGSDFNQPGGVAVDASGNVFFSEPTNNVVKELLTDGTIKTIGSGFFSPGTLAVDAAGDVFVVDTLNYAVKKVSPDGTITTIGSGCSAPIGVAVDVVGDVFVSDFSSGRLVKVSPPSIAAMPSSLSASAVSAVSGVLTGVAPNTTYYYRVLASSAAGTVADPLNPPKSFTTLPPTVPIVSVGAAVSITATTATLQASVNPEGATTLSRFQYSTDPTFLPVVVTSFGPAFHDGFRVAVDRAGNVFVADSSFGSITEVMPDGTTKAIASGMYYPGGIAVDEAGDVFVSQPYSAQVVEILPDGTIKQIGSGFNGPSGVAVDGAGNVFVSERLNQVVQEVLPDGTIKTIGSGFQTPLDLALDSAGDVFVADIGTDKVNEILPDGTIKTIGSGFLQPNGVAVDAAGNVFVADTGHGVLKEVLPSGVIRTIADGSGIPNAVTVSVFGDVFVANSSGGQILELSPPSVTAVPTPLYGTTATPVTGALAGLIPGTTYYYRVLASNAVGAVVDLTSPPRTFTTLPATTAADAPLRIVGAPREGPHAQPTSLVLTFSAGLNPVRAHNRRNYHLISPGGVRIPIVRVRYKAGSRTVTLWTGRRLLPTVQYTLRVNGDAPRGLTDAAGNLLDGNGDGHPGGDSLMRFDRRSWSRLFEANRLRGVARGPRACSFPQCHFDFGSSKWISRLFNSPGVLS
jgi:sugar lactone lactonase YvrE